MNGITNHGFSRSWLLLGAAGVLTLGLIAGPLLNTAPRAVRAADATTVEHLITVNGSGKVTVTPDVADVSLGVQIQRETAKAARDGAASAMTAVISTLKNMGIADEDIQTTGLNLSPVYDYNSSSPRITGYQVSNMVNVHVRDIDKVADVIDGAVAAGATSFYGVSFDVADRSAAENQARDAAVKNARSHADALASAAGVTITGVATISETSASSPWPWYGAAGDTNKGPDAAPSQPTPIQPGSQDITVTVTVAYTI